MFWSLIESQMYLTFLLRKYIVLQFDIQNIIISRSSRSQVLLKIIVHKMFAKFTEKRLSQRVLFNKAKGCRLLAICTLLKDNPVQALFCEFLKLEIGKNNFYTEHPRIIYVNLSKFYCESLIVSKRNVENFNSEPDNRDISWLNKNAATREWGLPFLEFWNKVLWF